MSKRDRDDIAEVLARRAILASMPAMSRHDLPADAGDTRMRGPTMEEIKREYEMRRLLEETAPPSRDYEPLYRPQMVPADQPSSEYDEATGTYWNRQL